MTACGSILLGLLLACSPPAAHRGGEVGQAAPEYTATTLDGDTVALTDFLGQPVLLNIWATWCPPCRREMPDLQKLHERYGPTGLTVVGVSVDGRNAEPQIREFLDELGIDFLILHDPRDEVSDLFAIPAVPVTLLIDPDGVIRWRHMGPVTSDDPSLMRVLRPMVE